jgi:hypothetical protein
VSDENEDPAELLGSDDGDDDDGEGRPAKKKRQQGGAQRAKKAAAAARSKHDGSTRDGCGGCWQVLQRSVPLRCELLLTACLPGCSVFGVRAAGCLLADGQSFRCVCLRPLTLHRHTTRFQRRQLQGPRAAGHVGRRQAAARDRCWRRSCQHQPHGRLGRGGGRLQEPPQQGRCGVTGWRRQRQHG